MKKIIFIFIIFLISIITLSVIINPKAFFLNITSTLNLWLFKVYPSVFTFYIISSLLLNTNILNKFIYYFRFIFKRLKFEDQNLLNIYILSIFIGNPSSSNLIIENIDKNNLSISYANKLLRLSSFMNPLFILAFIYPYNIKYAYFIIIIHILSNLIITIFENRNNENTKISNLSLKFNLRDIITSINNIIFLILIISSMMVISNIIIFSLTTIFNLLKINNLYLTIFLSQLEISSGLKTILSLNINSLLIYLLVSITIAFNGLSIHLQVLNIVSKYNLKYKTYFLYRIIQGLLSIILFLIFILIEKSLY